MEGGMMINKDFLLLLAAFLAGIVSQLIYDLLKIRKIYMVIVVLILVPSVIALFYYGTSPSIQTGFDNSSASKSSYNNRGYNLYLMGEKEGANKSFEEANRFFDKALEEDPDYALAWGNKGNALAKLGRKAEADKAFANARSLQIS
jgi:tetratricopeptide (TPR) repeat protein